VIFNVLIRQN